MMASHTLFDFDEKADTSGWRIVNDGVMGGLSKGIFEVTTDGHGRFHGYVSLENNGGFSMVKYNFETEDVAAHTQFVIKLKGDGKTYQFRAKPHDSDAHSYVHTFETSGQWQTIVVPFESLSPAYRGRSLDRPNFEGQQLAEIAFLIGNKKAEDFNLLIDHIVLE